jgi:hypothetical protein
MLIHVADWLRNHMKRMTKWDSLGLQSTDHAKFDGYPNQFPHNSPSRNLLFFPSPERSSTANGLPPGQNTTPTQTITEHGKIMAKSAQFWWIISVPLINFPSWLASMPSGTNIVRGVFHP